MAICNIALHLSRNGHYMEADAVTRFAASQYAHFQQRSQMWKLIDLHVAFYRTLWINQWDRAEQIAIQLGVFDRTESLIKRAHLLLCKGDTIGGKSVLDELDRLLSCTSLSSSSNRLPSPGLRMGQRLRLKVPYITIIYNHNHFLYSFLLREGSIAHATRGSTLRPTELRTSFIVY